MQLCTSQILQNLRVYTSISDSDLLFIEKNKNESREF